MEKLAQKANLFFLVYKKDIQIISKFGSNEG